MRKNGCPCSGCEERSVECHGKCEKYKAWCDKRKEDKEKLIAEKAKESVYMSFKAESKDRMRRLAKKRQYK